MILSPPGRSALADRDTYQGQTAMPTTLLTQREFDALTYFCFHNNTDAAGRDLRDWIGHLNDLDEAWTAHSIKGAIVSGLDAHGDCAGERAALKRALKKVEVLVIEAEQAIIDAHRADTDRACTDALGAYGWCSAVTLAGEVRTRTGLSLAMAAAAVFFWTEDPRVQIDDHGNYFIEGLGGA